MRPPADDGLDAPVLRVFADGPGGGNPCPVVVGAHGLDAPQMQEVARRFGLETAFVLPPTLAGCDVRLRYFVPNHEMEMCVHATVAALVLLASRGSLSRGKVVVQSPLGAIDAHIEDDGSVAVDQFAPTVAEAHVTAADLGAALGCTPTAFTMRDTPRSVSVSRSKLLVELDEATTLHALRPAPDRVAALCRRTQTTGLYPFAVSRDNPRAAWARQFPMDSGYPEDAATGLAAAALGVLLATREHAPGTASYDIHQGQAMGHPSRITVRITRGDAAEIDRVTVVGTAEAD